MAKFLKSDVPPPKDFTIDLRITGQEAALLLEVIARCGGFHHPLNSLLREIQDNTSLKFMEYPARIKYGWRITDFQYEFEFVGDTKNADQT